jgi:hypothetical protein
MKIFISYFFMQEQQITQTGFKTLAQSFKNTVVVVHAQWLMDKKPNIVRLSSLNTKDNSAITVNAKGWIDSMQSVNSTTLRLNNSTNTCEAIWQLAISRPMSLMKFSIAAIEIHHENLSNFHQCRYILSTGEYFEYHSATGLVTQVKSS